MNIILGISVEDLVVTLCENNTWSDLASFIVAIDLEAGDAGFTEDVVKRMMASLKKDYKDCPEEYAELLKELA